MGIKRYVASKDNTITNAFKPNLRTRASDANMGASDILETFSIYGQATTGSAELARILIEFPISEISADRSAGDIPASGSVEFYLRMFNAKHSETLPKNYNLQVRPVSRAWDEGFGLDMDEYKDKGYTTITGSTWLRSSAGTSWTTPGGDYHDNYGATFSQHFKDGDENLEVNITTLVEQWINSAGNTLGSKTNYGLGVFFTGSQEAFSTASDGAILANTTGPKMSYYTKKFHGRTSEFYFKRPHIEARWSKRIHDDRGNVYYHSHRAPNGENINTLYFYNFVRGRLRDIPNIGNKIYVRLYSGSADNTAPASWPLSLTGGTHGGGVLTDGANIIRGYRYGTGIYSASFALTSSDLTKVFDVWSQSSDGTGVQYHTSSFFPKSAENSSFNDDKRFVVKITNIKDSYDVNETARFRVFSRPKNWNPNIYNVATSEVESTIIESASYRVYRAKDNLEVVRHSTGSSTEETYMHYDVSGNFFDLDMKLLEPGYTYGIELAYYLNDNWQVQKEKFRFRVEDFK